MRLLGWALMLGPMVGRGSQCPKGAGLCPGAHEGTFVASFGSCCFVLRGQEWDAQGRAEVGCTRGYEEGDAQLSGSLVPSAGGCSVLTVAFSSSFLSDRNC